MSFTHWMHADRTGAATVVFTCPEQGCGRRVIIDQIRGMEVVDRGDFFARHIGTIGPMDVSLELAEA